MKKFLPSILILTLSVLFTQTSDAQTTVSSTTGYSVTLNVRPVRVVVNQYWNGGYTYQVEMSYNVSFTGSNIPAELWNTEGTLGCNSQTNGFALPKNAGAGTVYTYNTSANGDYRNATVANLGCTAVNIALSGPGITMRNVSVAQPIILGVKMASFTASLKSAKVSLDWSTASEENNKFFTIERSANGTTWSSIGEVKAAGNSTTLKYYSFIDASPVNGTSYYRIRQTDIDGQTTVSEVKTVNNSTGTAKISLFPIPNKGNTITITGIRDYSNHQLAVISATGNQVYTTTLSNATVVLPSLTTGFYFVRITDKTTGEVTNIRYIKN